jgi:hypothetical protein
MTDIETCKNLFPVIRTRDEYIRAHLPDAMREQRGSKRLRKKKALEILNWEWAMGSRENKQNVRFSGRDLQKIIEGEVDMMVAYYALSAMRGQTEQMCFFDDLQHIFGGGN